MVRKQRLLRLLLSEKLETVEAWAAILEDGGEYEVTIGAAVDGQEGGGRAPLIRSINEVVPHLPGYTMVSTSLKALMSYAVEKYPRQVNQLVQEWLRGGHSVYLRRWIIRDWLKCRSLTSVDSVELLQWRHALFVATINETAKALKWALLGYLNAVDEAIGDQFEDGKVTTRTPDAAMPSMKSVEELLGFYFLHAEQLASCSLLCAAKLHALAVRDQRSSVKLVEDDEVLVRLRWSLMLKPMLFKPLLQHAIALKTMPGKATASQYWSSEELERLVGLVDITDRMTFLDEMHARRDELECAFKSGVEHIYSSTSKERSAVEAAVAEYLGSLSDEKRLLLVKELERDLDEAPPHLFPYVFMFFGLVLSATLLLPDQDLVVEAVSILFALLYRRTHDANSCLDAFSLLLRLQVASNVIWHDNALYLQAIESLSEQATLQVEPKLKWVARMALHQLLFECDVQVLQHNTPNLSKLLPRCTMRLVSMRLGN
ncbi:hypothetical protein F441_21780 [Phytophthora nicotianae CJ01A1]|uniref:Uncharacterized protein n=1 Tax=Phytophthora nicotianae CJ01A1 TaxID=1317063 RepID=W2VU28_PHYNI|nr:hypothetical protein F441_21780 [Phytophthora nicotianae CJ01A1]